MSFACKSVAAGTLAAALLLAGCDSGPTEADTQGITPGAPAAASAASGEEVTAGDGAAAGASAASGEEVTAGDGAAAPGAEASPSSSVAAAPPPSFAICGTCHSVEPGDNGVGPSLAGIYGDKAGQVPGFASSEAMKSSGLVWDEANLDKYLESPMAVVPGTKMIFAGLKDAAQRQAVIDYIKGLQEAGPGAGQGLCCGR